MQPICKTAFELSHFVVGDVQVVDLSFKCVEGDCAPNGGSLLMRGMEDVATDNLDPTQPPTIHIQFQRSVNFVLVSVHDKIERFIQEALAMFGFADREDI